MIKHITLILLLLLAISGYSQVNEKYISGKWQMTKARSCYNSRCLDTLYTYPEYLILSPDHTCQIPSAITGNVMKGYWQCKDSIITVTLSNGREFKMKTLKLTPGNMEGMVGSGDYKSTLFFIRKDQ